MMFTADTQPSSSYVFFLNGKLANERLSGNTTCLYLSNKPIFRLTAKSSHILAPNNSFWGTLTSRTAFPFT